MMATSTQYMMMMPSNEFQMFSGTNNNNYNNNNNGGLSMYQNDGGMMFSGAKHNLDADGEYCHDMSMMMPLKKRRLSQDNSPAALAQNWNYQQQQQHQGQPHEAAAAAATNYNNPYNASNQQHFSPTSSARGSNSGNNNSNSNGLIDHEELQSRLEAFEKAQMRTKMSRELLAQTMQALEQAAQSQSQSSQNYQQQNCPGELYTSISRRCSTAFGGPTSSNAGFVEDNFVW